MYKINLTSEVELFFHITHMTRHILYLQQPVFRYKECEGIQPNPLSTFGVPRDILDLATGTDASKLVDLLKLVSFYS